MITLPDVQSGKTRVSVQCFGAKNRRGPIVSESQAITNQPGVRGIGKGLSFEHGMPDFGQRPGPPLPARDGASGHYRREKLPRIPRTSERTTMLPT